MNKTNKCILIFPPNWSACVSGAHLALPLIAGAIKATVSNISVWDMSEEFYRLYGKQPDNVEIQKACANEDIEKLDNLYFDWEDSFIPMAKKFNHSFGLLSGFSNGAFKAKNINTLAKKLNNETVFTNYFETFVKIRLEQEEPNVIGISISSYQQIFPVVELLEKLRCWLPKCKIVLGGNILTRLQGTESLEQLKSKANKIILYQGETAMVDYITQLGSNTLNTENAGSEKIDFNDWPIPYFKGLNVGNYPGGVNTLSYVSARGCYYGKCSFCAIPAGWSKSGFAGSAPGDFVVAQIKQMIATTKINKIKFVDEAFFPGKVESILSYYRLIGIEFFWEAYARVEKQWENETLIKSAYESGCRRLYFGLEMAPSANREPLLKNDKGDIMAIMEKCKKYGILVHLFCMVGHPGTEAKDAELTVKFLVDNQHLVDTCDMVGFRLDRGTNVIGVKRKNKNFSDFAMSYEYEPVYKGGLTYKNVFKLEEFCQEILWEEVPRLLHPLYRIGNEWNIKTERKTPLFLQINR